MSIEVYIDWVVIAGQKVLRPKYISRSVWLRFWERLRG